MDKFFKAFLECALWSSMDESTPEGGEPLDKNYDIDDFSEEALEQLEKDCLNFQEENESDLLGIDDESAGHDFWLTRNRHGAGFWDRGYPEPQSSNLTKAAHVLCHLIEDRWRL